MDKENFTKAAMPWIKLHDTVEISILGVNTDDGTRAVLSARVTIGGEGKASSLPEINCGVFWARKEVLNKSGEEIHSIVETLLGGSIPLRDCIVPLIMKTDNERYSTYCDLSYGNKYIAESTLPRQFRLNIRGGYAGIFNTSENDHFLRVLDTPFADINELCDFYGAPKLQNEAMIEVVVNPPISLDASCHIESGNAQVFISASASLRLDRFSGIKVGFIRRGGETVDERGTADIVKWMPSDEKFIGTATIPIGDSSHVDLFLSYGGEMAHNIRLHNKDEIISSARAVYSCCDPGDKALSGVLFSRDKSLSKQFEEAFSILLHLLGFSVVHYGGVKSIADNAPDIIAYCAAGSVAVIECTVGLPNQGDQVAKIIQRTSLIKGAFKSDNVDIPGIYPIIVTNLSESEISTHREDAERAGVAVVCREGIEELLNYLDTLISTDKILERMTMHRFNPIWSRFGAG